MKKVFKLLLLGSFLTFIIAIFFCCSGCAKKSPSVSIKEDAASKIDTAGYPAYEGKYELAPNFIITITKIQPLLCRRQNLNTSGLMDINQPKASEVKLKL